MKVDLIGDASSLRRAFRSAGVDAKKFGHEASRTRRIAGAAFKAIGIGGLVAGGLIVKGLKDSIAQAIEAQKVDAQTAAVLKSTGAQAGVTSQHIEKMATKLMLLTSTDDEAVQSTENLLLTFRTLRNEAGKGNDVFDQATLAVLDMSAALGQDTKSSAIQLGKALGDPVRGMTALRRVGVIFTDSQTAMIKKLAESGHLLEAQKMILKEVQKEFGGSAKAAGHTFGGQLRLLNVQIDNIKETIGTALLPQLNKWVRSINLWLSKAKNQRKVIHDIRVAARILVGAVKALIVVSRVLVHSAQGWIMLWRTAKKHTLQFYNWLLKTGLKIALAVLEPFSHLPGKLGAWARDAKTSVQTQLAAIGVKIEDPGAAPGTTGPVGRPGGGGGRVPGMRGPQGPRGGLRGPVGPVHVHHTHVHVDGKEMAHVVTKHQQRHKRRNQPQRTGRHPGTN